MHKISFAELYPRHEETNDEALVVLRILSLPSFKSKYYAVFYNHLGYIQY